MSPEFKRGNATEEGASRAPLNGTLPNTSVALVDGVADGVRALLNESPLSRAELAEQARALMEEAAFLKVVDLLVDPATSDPKFPDDPELAEVLAQTYRELRRYDACLDVLERLKIGHIYDTPNLMELVVEGLVVLGRLDEVRGLFGKKSEFLIGNPAPRALKRSLIVIDRLKRYALLQEVCILCAERWPELLNDAVFVAYYSRTCNYAHDPVKALVLLRPDHSPEAFMGDLECVKNMAYAYIRLDDLKMAHAMFVFGARTFSRDAFAGIRRALRKKRRELIAPEKPVTGDHISEESEDAPQAADPEALARQIAALHGEEI